MSSSENISDNWLLVEWKNGGRDVVYIKAIVNPEDKVPEIGESMTVNNKGDPETATLIARASERETLESMIKKEETPGACKECQQDDEVEDYCSSASSWTPSDDDVQSDDSTTVNQKKKNLERYKRQYTNRSSKKVLTPSNKANAVLDTTNRKRAHDDKEQTQRKKSNTEKIQTPNTTKNQIPPKVQTTEKKKNPVKVIEAEADETVPVKVKMTKELKQTVKTVLDTFKVLFKEVDELKKPIHLLIGQCPDKYEFQRIVSPTLKIEGTANETVTEPVESVHEHFIENEHSDNEEFNRSDDNVLISNKYTNASINTEAAREEPNKEWVAIGSGKTLIHKDKFKKINWKSYTVATRTLLMAVFPRKVLATHSLTGKCSPAFMNKPAKMCLDPKKIIDIVLEIMDRFKVKENLVRSIITTKCADEAKMWKTRNNKSIANKKKQKKNDENVEVA